MKLKKYEQDMNHIKSDKRLKEEDLREYSRMGQQVIIEELNETVRKFNEKEPAMISKDGKSKIWGTGTGDIQVDIVKTDKEIEISVYELKKRWNLNK